MSALAPLLGVKRTRCPNWPSRDMRTHLLDHLVGAELERGRQCYSKRFGSPKVDHQLELGRLLDRQVGWFFAFENATRISAYKPVSVRKIATVTHHATSRRKLAILVDCWNLVPESQSGELVASAVKEIIWTDHEPVCVQLDHRYKGCINFLVGARI